jgi:hypothetical protein
LGVSYHIGMRVVTHSQIALTAYQELARFDAVDRAGCAGQSHSFVDFRVVAHHRDAANLQAEATLFLRCAQKPCVLAAVALRVLLHAALGPAEDADLESLLLRDQAAIIAAAAHDCRSRRCRHRRRERRRASAVVVPRLAGGDVAAVDGRIGVAGVGVQVARDLGVGGCRQ